MSKIRVLFVCMGNICRSPTAECVFRDLVEKRGLAGRFEIDSAGTTGYHVGEPPDRRMTDAAAGRGIRLTGQSRQFVRADFDDFDAIVAMDDDNLDGIRSLDPSGRHASKVHLMLDFHPDHAGEGVPDPYYGGRQGFERVLDLLEEACPRLLDELLKQAGE